MSWLRGAKITWSGYHAAAVSVGIFTLCIQEYNLIDGIVWRKFKERYQFQFYKRYYKVCYWVVIGGEVGGGISKE